MNEGQKKEKAVSVVEQEILRIHFGDLSADEIKKAVSLFKLELYRKNANLPAKARFLAKYEIIASSFEFINNLIDQLNVTNYGEVTAVSRKYLQNENRTIEYGKEKGGM